MSNELHHVTNIWEVSVGEITIDGPKWLRASFIWLTDGV